MREFNPMESERPPREEGWREETEEVAEMLHERGDQRIGQLIINAIRTQYDLPEFDHERLKQMDELDEIEDERDRMMNKRKARIEKILWNLEADELAELLRSYIQQL